jgi:hypothetical protein
LAVIVVLEREIPVICGVVGTGDWLSVHPLPFHDHQPGFNPRELALFAS